MVELITLHDAVGSATETGNQQEEICSSQESLDKQHTLQEPHAAELNINISTVTRKTWEEVKSGLYPTKKGWLNKTRNINSAGTACTAPVQIANRTVPTLIDTGSGVCLMLKTCGSQWDFVTHCISQHRHCCKLTKKDYRLWERRYQSSDRLKDRPLIPARDFMQEQNVTLNFSDKTLRINGRSRSTREEQEISSTIRSIVDLAMKPHTLNTSIIHARLQLPGVIDGEVLVL